MADTDRAGGAAPGEERVERVLVLAGSDDPGAAAYCRERTASGAEREPARLRVLAGRAAAALGADTLQREESSVVVAVGGRTRSRASPANGVAPAWAPTKTLPARGSLREVGTTVDGYLVGWGESGYRPVACIDSLTGLLEHTSVRGAYRFLYVLLHRAESVGADVHVHADPDAYDEEIVRTFYPLFDRVESPDGRSQIEG